MRPLFFLLLGPPIGAYVLYVIFAHSLWGFLGQTWTELRMLAALTYAFGIVPAALGGWFDWWMARHGWRPLARAAGSGVFGFVVSFLVAFATSPRAGPLGGIVGSAVMVACSVLTAAWEAWRRGRGWRERTPAAARTNEGTSATM